MREERPGIRTAEKIAGIVAVVAALIVLNGAWVNQHNWQNVSWRVAVAALLVVLAIVVETNVFGLLRPREREEEAAVPDFMRAALDAPSQSSIADSAQASPTEVATTAEQH